MKTCLQISRIKQSQENISSAMIPNSVAPASTTSPSASSIPFTFIWFHIDFTFEFKSGLIHVRIICSDNFTILKIKLSRVIQLRNPWTVRTPEIFIHTWVDSLAIPSFDPMTRTLTVALTMTIPPFTHFKVKFIRFRRCLGRSLGRCSSVRSRWFHWSRRWLRWSCGNKWWRIFSRRRACPRLKSKNC